MITRPSESAGEIFVKKKALSMQGKQTDIGTNMHYTLKDHQGNLTATVCGDAVERLSYDAWGSLRNPETWSGGASAAPMFDRGFTGHEHMTAFGLINMNGRCYDPLTSSFLSVDRYVQSPGNSQGFNRYAYCMYNPLRFTDPNGWHCGPPKSKSGLIQDYLADPCYITRQALRDAGLYDIEGGYGYASGHGTMCARWKEGDGSANQSSWSIHTESGGMSCGAWAVPSSWNNYETTESSNGYESNGGGYNQPVGLPTGGGGGSSGGYLFDSNATSIISVQSHAPQKIHSAKNLFFKTYWHYQFGGRNEYWVDASTLDFDYISQKDLNYKNGIATINLFNFSVTDQTALALGKITLVPKGNNQFEIEPDDYDFNVEWENGWSKRNVATVLAGYFHGPVIDNYPIPTYWMGGRPCYIQPSYHFGGPFQIRFKNTVYIKP